MSLHYKRLVGLGIILIASIAIATAIQFSGLIMKPDSVSTVLPVKPQEDTISDLPPSTQPVLTGVLPMTQDTVRTIRPENVHLKSHNYFLHEQGGFKLILEKGWEVVDSRNISLPEKVPNPEFVFSKIGTPCVLMYLRWGNSSDIYKQFTFGDRIMSSGGQLDSSWYIHANHLPQGFSFAGHYRMPLDHEAEIFYFSPVQNSAHGPGTFMLWSQDTNNPVMSDCVDETAAMLSTLEISFKPTTVEVGTSGTVYISSMNDGDSSTQHVLFVDTKGSISEIMKVSGYGYYSLYKGQLYVRNNGTIMSVDLITRSITELPLMRPPGTEINNMFIYNNLIYYFAGQVTCNEYRAHCTQDLYSYDLASHESKKLGSSISARGFVGIDPVQQIFRLNWSDGDAGCAWISFLDFDFRLGTTTAPKNYSYCGDDAGSAAAEAQVRKLQAIGTNQATSTTFLLLKAGQFQYPTGSSQLQLGPHDEIKVYLQ